jgi:hypothetical protein
MHEMVRGSVPAPAQKVDESACKPGSVPGRLAAIPFGDHPSRRTVAGTLVRSTRRLGRAALEHLRAETPEGNGFSTLLRVGFAEPSRSPGALVVSYTTVSP